MASVFSIRTFGGVLWGLPHLLLNHWTDFNQTWHKYFTQRENQHMASVFSIRTFGGSFGAVSYTHLLFPLFTFKTFKHNFLTFCFLYFKKSYKSCFCIMNPLKNIHTHMYIVISMRFGDICIKMVRVLQYDFCKYRH